MRALRVYGKDDFRIEDIPEPQPGPGEVKLEVRFCGICGSDVHDYVEGPRLLPVGRPHPQTGRIAPITYGHEFSASVVEVGSAIEGIRPGDRVVVRPTMPCYRCRYCREGRAIQCTQLAAIGGAADGAYARFAVARADCVLPLPASVSWETGAYAEPLACGVRAVRRSRLEPGAVAAVIGAGPIGLLTMQMALACGAREVYVFETAQVRRELALRLGATAVLDPREGDPGRVIGKLTGGQRVDVAFECAGTGPALQLADQVSGRGATIVQVGVQREPVTFDFFSLFFREKTIVTSQGYSNPEFEIAVGLLGAGRIKPHPVMTSAIIPLEEVISGGIEALLGPQRESHCKILVAP